MNATTTFIPCHIRTVRGSSEPVVTARGGVAMASSRDVAAYFGKQHSVVMRTIRDLIKNDNLRACNFALSHEPVQMPTGGMRQQPVYHMDRDGFTLLVMGFTGKRAQEWKWKYIEAFNAMEAELSKPRLQSDAMHRDWKPTEVDQMDGALDLLLTAEAALSAAHWNDAESLTSIRNVVSMAIRNLAPIRGRLDAR